MRRHLRGLFGLSVIAFLLVSFLPLKIAAQTSDGSFNLVTSPLPINLKAKPGTRLETDIRIKNGGISTERLRVSLMKFTAYGEEGKPGLAEREPSDDYFDWVSFSPELFDAPPNEWITIKMTINLPTDAAFGYYYAAVFSRADEPAKPQEKQNVIVGSTAVLVLVDADVPNAKRTAVVEGFSVSKKSYEYLPAEFTVKVKNSGNIHLIPTGNIFITRGSRTVGTLALNSASGNVLPGSNRIFTANWTDGFPAYIDKESGGKVVLDEQGKAVKTLKWDMSKLTNLRIGRYTAKLLLVYDDGTKDVPLEASVSFWVIPWRLLGLSFVVLVVPTSLVIYLLIKNRRLKKAIK